jgi:hypothetical protein
MAERGRRTQFAVAGWLFGSASVVLGLLIHAVSGHPVPAAPIVVATAALLSLAATVLIRTGVPNWALLVLAGVEQQAIHWAFAFFSDPLATTLAAAAGSHGHAVPSSSPAPACCWPACQPSRCTCCCTRTLRRPCWYFC